MNFDITIVVEAVLLILGIIVTRYIVPWVREKTSAAEQETINTWIRAAVAAAEQIYAGSGRGAEKKAYVTRWLAERGFNVKSETVDLLIESAVYELKEGIF